MGHLEASHEHLARLYAQSEARMARLETDVAGLKGTSPGQTPGEPAELPA